MAAVQSVINRLESYGYPVHRYHADRAQELKSKALVSWLRDRGIHPSWTPGDSPAGNRAEVAVQQLKQASRRLLAEASLEAVYWPLAVLHASNRFWVTMAESLGIPQPVLLPFGLRLHARKRFATGYNSHWRQRTVAGQYLGQAPNTPNTIWGHLVLVLEGDGTRKVLLTNTLYPLMSSAIKPKLRLRTKTAPRLVLKLVSAKECFLTQEISAFHLSRLSPGGEWGDGDGESDGSEWEVFGILVDSDANEARERVLSEFLFSRALCEQQASRKGSHALCEQQASLEGSQALCEQQASRKGSHALCEQQASLEGSHALCEQQASLEGSHALCEQQASLEGSHALCEQQVPLVGSHSLQEQQTALVDSPALREQQAALVDRPALQEQQTPFYNGFSVVRMETAAAAILPNATFLEEECLTLLQTGGSVSEEEKGGFEVLRGSAVFVVSGGEGGRFPSLEKYFDRFVEHLLKDLAWTAVSISRNEMPDLSAVVKEQVPSGVCLLGEFKGGGLWVQDDSALATVVRFVPGRGMCTGKVIDNRGFGIRIETGAAFLVEPWTGGDLWVLRAFEAQLLTREYPYKGLAAGSTDHVSWEVEFPYEVLTEGRQEQWASLHEAASYQCQQALRDLSGAPMDCGLVGTLARQLRVLEAEKHWYEGLLAASQPWSEASVAIRSLQAEVPLSPEGTSAPEQFLQTRTVRLEEARRELWEWLEPARDEVVALEQTTQAVERITADEVESMVKQGQKVLQVPGKAVLTRKSGVGKRRFRAVCCGNFLPASEMGSNKSDLYAGGVDSLTVRVVLAYTAQFPEWTL